MQKYGGISRYFVELIKYFDKAEEIQYELPIRDATSAYLKNIEPFRGMNLSDHFLSKIKGKFIFYKILDLFDKRSNRNLVINKLISQNFDIFHPTYYSTYFLKYLKNKPFVLTIHDMIHEKYPQFFLLDISNTVLNKKKLALRASKIIAISESTKRDIIEFYNIPEDKIKVIYHGVSLIPVKGKPQNTPTLPSKYILFVGSRNIYKNFIFFIKSIRQLLNEDKELNIVIAGGGSFSKKEKNLIISLGIEHQIIQYSVDDQILSYLYQNAICFVFPSLYEGFGIPVLEAFSCNCPAIISNTSSLPEIGGNAAEYFNPIDSDSILRAVKKVVYDEIFRSELINKGQHQLKKFSWEKTAIQTIELYKTII